MELGLNRLPWFGQIGAFLAVSIALFVVFRIYYVGPQLEAQTQKQAQLDEKLSEVAQAQQDAIELAAFQAEVDDLNDRLEALSAVLPEREEAAQVLRRLLTFAVQANLTLTGFTPQAPVTREMHSEWAYELALEGTYHNLGMFFDRVSKFSRIINLSDVVIRANEPAELNRTITAECTATTFVLLDPAEPAPDAAAPPAA